MKVKPVFRGADDGPASTTWSTVCPGWRRECVSARAGYRTQAHVRRATRANPRLTSWHSTGGKHPKTRRTHHHGTWT
jgi:hypothetical protein